MNKHLFTWSSVVFVALIGLSACQQADDGESVSADDQGTAANEVPENIMIEGLAGHYHTNDAISLRLHTQVSLSTIIGNGLKKIRKPMSGIQLRGKKMRPSLVQLR